MLERVLPLSAKRLTGTSPADRRSVRRQAARITISYRPASTRKKCSLAQVQDVSPTGVALLLDVRCIPGRVLVLELQHRKQARPRLLLARVVHVTPKPSGRWLAGCEFARALSSDELLAFTG